MNHRTHPIGSDLVPGLADRREDLHRSILEVQDQADLARNFKTSRCGCHGSWAAEEPG